MLPRLLVSNSPFCGIWSSFFLVVPSFLPVVSSFLFLPCISLFLFFYIFIFLQDYAIQVSQIFRLQPLNKVSSKSNGLIHPKILGGGSLIQIFLSHSISRWVSLFPFILHQTHNLYFFSIVCCHKWELMALVAVFSTTRLPS